MKTKWIFSFWLEAFCHFERFYAGFDKLCVNCVFDSSASTSNVPTVHHQETGTFLLRGYSSHSVIIKQFAYMLV